MIVDTVPHRLSLVDRLDPRIRVVAGIALSLMPITLSSWRALGIMLALAVALVIYERISLGQLAGRLGAVNLFVGMLLLLLPWSIPGDPLVIAGGLEYSAEGLARVGRIALRANIIVMVLVVFLSTLETVTLGHALQRLRLPGRLVVLLMFTVRYMEVFEREYLRLRQAMRIRGFRPATNRHTFRTYGYLVGMLLVRAFERSERIQQAMRCRGFSGRFHTHHHMRMKPADWAFAVGLAFALAAIGVAEWA